MPLTKKGAKIKRAMAKTYGPERGENVFYASENAGTITGVHKRMKKTGRHSRSARTGIGGRPT